MASPSCFVIGVNRLINSKKIVVGGILGGEREQRNKETLLRTFLRSFTTQCRG